MKPGKRRTDLAVLLLHNIDPLWGLSEIEAVNAAVGAMSSAMSGQAFKLNHSHLGEFQSMQEIIA